MNVVLVGGVVEPKKLAWARATFGHGITWCPSRRSVAIDALVCRLRRRRLSGLVVLEALLGHNQYGALVDAARAAGVPVAYAQKGGQGALRRALTDLATRPGAASECSAGADARRQAPV